MRCRHLIEQVKVQIDPEDTGYGVLKKYKQMCEQILRRIGEPLERRPQNHELATIFGKRTPQDGQINWLWQAQRIINWIRVQLRSYPGAFTFLGDTKLTVHQAKLTDLGFNDQIPNGYILRADASGLYVKTPNAVLYFHDIETLPKMNPVGMVLTDGVKQ